MAPWSWIPRGGTFNIVLMAVAFMIYYTGFLPTNYIEQTVISSIKVEDPSFDGDGYTSLAIIYLVFAFATWGSPFVIEAVGPKYCMVIGYILCSFFMASFLKPLTWTLYLTSVLAGLGTACVWTGQGTYLTINSAPETISRNSGIFWAMFEFSLLFGNLIVYFNFQGLTIIDSDTRFTMYIVLLVVSCVGTIALCTLPNTSIHTQQTVTESSPTNTSSSSTPFQRLLRSVVRAGRLLVTKDMLLLSITFIFTGLELGFFSGVYGTALGFTQHFGDRAKQLVGLNGILIGVGEISGGAIFGILGKWTNRYGRDPAFLFGFLVHLLAYYLIFLNLPDDSPKGETLAHTYIHSSESLALLCSFLLGLGDGCFNPQIISILGSMYPNDSATAFALYKFIQSLATVCSFFYSNHLLLYQQLLLLVLSGTVGLLAFWYVEWDIHIRNMKSKSEAAAVNPAYGATDTIAQDSNQPTETLNIIKGEV